YKHGVSAFKYILWHFVSSVIFMNPLNPSSAFRVFILRRFGAKIGNGVAINKPNINIKYPWKLTIGNNVWIGEKSWIYNMDEIIIGDNVNIAQGVMLLTGNHNYKSTEFEVFTKPITIEDGVFLGAFSIVCPGVVCKSHSILSVGSIAKTNLEPYTIYEGNPALPVRERVINS
ncbi:MAG: WcaF family extracellular polysaccharide biosynthesis acetyltransferase, partial [Bacteroidota bacterium]|nr:WcaF family extracellular polysaccharide biosynthesis acetyltransferase [Bacteroidota bacterium]